MRHLIHCNLQEEALHSVDRGNNVDHIVETCRKWPGKTYFATGVTEQKL